MNTIMNSTTTDWLTLVIMAAGMWSRYGWWWRKQIDDFWPSGETILEYSIYDAIQAWFDHVVLVIREEFQEKFHEILGSRFADQIRVSYAYQEINPQIDGLDLITREKPRGTGHAVLAAKELVTTNFCVINADDYYGPDAYRQMATYLSKNCKTTTCAMVWYILENTLSAHGTVNRWVCHIADDGTLIDIHERLKLQKNSPTTASIPEGTVFSLDSVVSMNFAWFHLSFFEFLETQFRAFLADHAQELTAEFFLPAQVNTFLHQAWHQCDVMISQDRRYGVTNPEDKPVVQEAMRWLVASWVYPTPLRWG